MIAVRRPAWWTRVGHIRGRLTLLVIVAAAPIVGMAGTIAWQEFQAAARTATERAALLDGMALATYRADATGIATRLAQSIRTDGAACDLAPLGFTFEGLVAGVAVVDRHSDIACASGDVNPIRPVTHWPETPPGGQPMLFQHGDTAGPVAIVARLPGGALAAAVLRAEWLAPTFLPDPVDPGSAYWLINPAGHTVASRGDAQAALPDVGTIVRLFGSDQETALAASAAGGRYAYATTLLPGGWRLLAAASAEREHQKAVRALMLRLAELAALLVFGSACVVIGADVAFGTPLRRLSGAVRKWQADGEFQPGPLVGAPDEVQDLAASFREATAVLRQRQQDLLRAREKQDLLVLEIHHRVKNNLQVIASLLNLQAGRIRVPEAKAEFQAARDRVRALATLHRHLYADGELHTINMRSFLTELCGQLFQAMGEKEGARISLSISAPELRMSSDQAVPLALIVTEAVTNSVKYAFPNGRSGYVSVTIAETGEGLELVISDDGVGIPAGRTETEMGTRDGIGLQLIRGFARQLGGTLVVEQAAGTRYTVRLAPAAPSRPSPGRPMDGTVDHGHLAA